MDAITATSRENAEIAAAMPSAGGSGGGASRWRRRRAGRRQSPAIARRWISPRRRTGRSIPCSDRDRARSGRWSTSCRAAGRTTRSASANRASARPPSSKGSRCTHPRRRRAPTRSERAPAVARSRPAAGRREREGRVREPSQERDHRDRRRRRRRSSRSSTKRTRSSAPAAPRAPATPRTCSSPRSRAASCARSPRPRGASTKYFEKDPALERRFQLVKLDEPSAADAVVMMRGLRDT